MKHPDETISDAAKLRVLADWFDKIQKNWFYRKLLGWSNSNSVQVDLRRIAKEIEEKGV